MRNSCFFFFFKDTAPTEFYTLPLHDALPIPEAAKGTRRRIIGVDRARHGADIGHGIGPGRMRSEEHTSELQSQSNLVCRLLLEKKKKQSSLSCSTTQARTRPRTAASSPPTRS